MTLRPLLAPALLVLLAPALSGCVLLAATGLVAGVSAARQERTIGNAIDDARIKTAVDTAMGRYSGRLFLNVSTTVVEGRVLLAGRVDTPEARLDATRIAWGVEGVRKVDNAVEVSSNSGWLDRPNDLYLRTALATVLLADNYIKDVNYTTDVVHGVVYLMGVAQSKEEVDRVVAHAEALIGVKRVENYVVLKTDPIRTSGPPPQPEPQPEPQ